MKRKDQLAEFRGKQPAQLAPEATQIKAAMRNGADTKNVHAKASERKRIARLMTVKREMEIINNG